MHLFEIPEAKVKRYIPEDLSECNQQQYIDMSDLIFKYQNQEIHYEEFRTHAFYKLANIKASKSKGNEDFKLANIYQASELIDSFFEDNEQGQKSIKQYYIHNHVPSIKPLFNRFYGPSDSFMNMSFGEYRDALRLFHDFHATGDMFILTLLAAIFYRPKKNLHFIKNKLPNYDGDIRIGYNSNTLEARAEQFKNFPLGFIYGFYLFFASFQKYFIEAKIMWGGKDIDFSILFESSGNTNQETEDVPGIGMDAIAFSMAESGAFGSINEVDKTNFWQIMIRMYDSRRTDLEQQKKENNATIK